MRLGSLKKLDEISTKNEIKNLREELKYLEKLIKNKKILDQFIINELIETNKKIDSDIIKRKSISNLVKSKK